MAKSKKILIVSAHADDHIICAGSVFKLRDQGYEVYEALLTDSGEGNDRRKDKSRDEYSAVVELREDEFNEASKFLGVKQKFMLNKEDLNLEFTKEMMLSVLKIIRDIKPDIIFTMNELDYHKDHVEAAKIVKEASFWAATGIRPELGEAHRTNMVLYGEGMLPIQADVLVNISGYEDKKNELFSIYESQANSKSVVFHQSLSRVRGYHLRKSSETEYAEAFSLNQKFPTLLFE